jgi:hypothetical protein
MTKTQRVSLHAIPLAQPLNDNQREPQIVLVPAGCPVNAFNTALSSEIDRQETLLSIYNTVIDAYNKPEAERTGMDKAIIEANDITETRCLQRMAMMIRDTLLVTLRTSPLATYNNVTLAWALDVNVC